MLAYLAIILSAAGLAVIQAVFLPGLPAPLAWISFAPVAMSYATVRSQPAMALLWALTAGIVLDLHGLFGFGAEIAALMVSALAMKIAFERVLTNTSVVTVFLLAALGALVSFLSLVVIDGFRVVFGQVPYVISSDSSPLSRLFGSMVIDGLLATAVALSVAAAGNFIRRSFLTTAVSDRQPISYE